VSCPVQAHVNRIVSKVNVYRAYIPRPRHRFTVNSAAIPAQLSSFRHVPHGLAVPGISRTFEAPRNRFRGASICRVPVRHDTKGKPYALQYTRP